MGARAALAAEGVAVRVVSMPGTSVFDRQDAAYRASVLPPGVPRVAVEAGSTAGWHKYVGAIDDGRGAIVGLDTFGESAPAGVLFKHFGFTVENVVAAVKRVVAMSPLAVRRATAGDAPAIARVRIDSWRTTYRGLIPDAYLDAMQVEASTALWDRVLTAGPNTTCVFVAEHEADIVGFSCGAPLQPTKHGFDSELAAVYLRREFQRAGLGRQLVSAVGGSLPRTGRDRSIDLGHSGQQGSSGILRESGRRAHRRTAIPVGWHGSGRGGIRLARSAWPGRSLWRARSNGAVTWSQSRISFFIGSRA